MLPPPEMPTDTEETLTTRASLRNSLKPRDVMDVTKRIKLDRLAAKVQRYDAISSTTDIAHLREFLRSDGYLRLANVPEGACLLTIIYGGSEETSIKTLNDTLLGMEDTESSIKLRQRTIRETLEAFGIVSPENHVVSKFRTDVYALSPAQLQLALQAIGTLPPVAPDRQLPASQFPVADAPHMSVLDVAIRSVEHIVQGELRKQVVARKLKLEAELKRCGINEYDYSNLNADSDTLGVKNIKAQRDQLVKWLETDQDRGMLLSFGLSEPIKNNPQHPGSIKDRLIAEAETLTGARMRESRSRARQRKTGIGVNQREKKGTEFDLAATVVDMLYEQNRLQGLEPATRDLYFEQTERNGRTCWELKESIISALRKKKLAETIPDEEMRLFIERYYGKLNRFDVIRPWPDIDAWGAHIEKMRQAAQSDDIETVRAAVLTHYKPTEDMTEGQFHAEASRQRRGYYLMADDIGMGNRNTLSFQSTFWNILSKIAAGNIALPRHYHDLKAFFTDHSDIEAQMKAIVKEEMLKSGTDVTEAYYRKVAIIKKHVTEYQRTLGKADRVISSSHSGDEFFAFIPLPSQPQWSQDNSTHKSNDPFLRMLANIQRDTGVRLAVAYKDLDQGHQAEVSDEYPIEISEHQACLESLEIAISKSKEMEAVQALQPTDMAAGYGFAVVQGHNYTFSTVLFNREELVVGKTSILAPMAKSPSLVPSERPLALRLVRALKGKTD